MTEDQARAWAGEHFPAAVDRLAAAGATVVGMSAVSILSFSRTGIPASSPRLRGDVVVQRITAWAVSAARPTSTTDAAGG